MVSGQPHLARLGRKMTPQALRRSAPGRRYQILISTAGPYGHRLGIDIERSHRFEREISRGCKGTKPGWVRIYFNYLSTKKPSSASSPPSTWSLATDGASSPDAPLIQHPVFGGTNSDPPTHHSASTKSPSPARGLLPTTPPHRRAVRNAGVSGSGRGDNASRTGRHRHPQPRRRRGLRTPGVVPDA